MGLYDNGTYGNASDGFLQRVGKGKFGGELTIDGVNISPIRGVFFEEQGTNYLWLTRKPLLEYDFERERYRERPREPRWETYLEKQNDNAIAYKGTFVFFKFRYSIVAIWDKVFGNELKRLNFFVERLPMEQQTIINNINERKRQESKVEPY